MITQTKLDDIHEDLISRSLEIVKSGAPKLSRIALAEGNSALDVNL